jgi:5-deoxy-D-glucuronate isomerase
MPMPPGYTIHVGETVHTSPGTWSSWPSHCAGDEYARYAEHEEVMWFCTQDYALMKRHGAYTTGEHVDDVLMIRNDMAVVAPWGSHEIVSSPAGWTYYYWGYVNDWVKKTYNRWAHEGVKVYVK